MIRTYGRRPVLELQIAGRSVTAIDPHSGEACVIATDADWDTVNGWVWLKANEIRASCRTDLGFNELTGRDLLARLYIAGEGALSALLGPVNARLRLPKIRRFFGARISRLASVREIPPIIDVKSTGIRPFPIEFLPLIGWADVAGSPGSSGRDIAQTMPAYSAVIRHVLIDQAASSKGPRQVPMGGLSVNVFMHDHLKGTHQELRFLRDLARRRLLKVITIFPHWRHRQRPFWPEIEVAELVARTASTRAPDARQDQFRMCHFSCHLRQPRDESAYLEMRPPWRPPWFGSERYDLNDLQTAAVDLRAPGPEVVFLGTCRSGIPDQATRTSAVKVFRYFAPDCIVGTIADVPDQTAAQFCSAFYEEFAAGTDIGAALRIARLNLLLGGLNNPFGLLFCSYFGENIHVAMRQDRRARYLPDETPAVLGPGAGFLTDEAAPDLRTVLDDLCDES